HHIFIHTHLSTTQNYTLSLHDALPISKSSLADFSARPINVVLLFARNRPALVRLSSVFCPSTFSRYSIKTHALRTENGRQSHQRDRKSTRLNSSHVAISYAVFCLKKKK